MEKIIIDLGSFTEEQKLWWDKQVNETPDERFFEFDINKTKQLFDEKGIKYKIIYYDNLKEEKENFIKEQLDNLIEEYKDLVDQLNRQGAAEILFGEEGAKQLYPELYKDITNEDEGAE
jgi:hypothetical protein